MKTDRCRILVVGAGPAGASAAAASAREGLKVLLVERKPKAGVPVRCAEYIPAPLLGEIDTGKDFVVQPVKGMRTFLPGGEVHEMRAPGYMIGRDLFDQALVGKAVDAGAEVLLSHRVLSVNDGTALIKRSDGGLEEVKADVVIGADGPHSVVGRCVNSINKDPMPAVQVSVPLTEGMDYTEVYFHKEIYGGYGWLFPKGETANVGLGMKTAGNDAGRIMRVLDRFADRLVEAGKIEKKILAKTAGWIPAGAPREAVRGRVLLAGDAAGHTNAITGAGVAQAVICGRLAGECAAKAVLAEDMGILSEYETQWRDLFGDVLSKASERRKLLEREWERLEEIIKYCWVAFREYHTRL